MKPTTLCMALFLLITAFPNGADAQAKAKQPFFEEFRESLIDLPPRSTLSKRGTLYVPAYSKIFVDSRGGHVMLATTLTVHNTSDKLPLVIERIDYFNSAGKLIKRFLDTPVALRPYSTVALLVPKEMGNGGTGANFKVAWAASASVPVPAVEAIMIGNLGTNSYSFVSPGRPVDMVESQ